MSIGAISFVVMMNRYEPGGEKTMKYVLFICADPEVKLTADQQTEAREGTESWVKEMDGRGVRLQ